MPMSLQLSDVLHRHERNVRKIKKTSTELNEEFVQMLCGFQEKHGISITQVNDLMLTSLRDLQFGMIRHSEIEAYMKGRQ
jgi:hypothetical protein